MSTPETETVLPSADRGYARRVELIDLGNGSSAERTYVHIPSRLLIDSVDVTHLVVSSVADLGHCVRMVSDHDQPTSVLEIDLLPGHLRLTPDAYGPATCKVELLVPRRIDRDRDRTLNLLTPRPPDGVPLVTELYREEPWRFRDRTVPGELVHRERIQMFADEILFSRFTAAPAGAAQ